MEVILGFYLDTKTGNFHFAKSGNFNFALTTKHPKIPMIFYLHLGAL